MAASIVPWEFRRRSGAIITTRRMPQQPWKWRGLFRWVGIAVLCIALCLLAAPVWLPAIGRWLVLTGSDAKDATVKAEVLGIPNSPWIGSGLGTDRLLFAADWIRQGRAKSIVMTCGTMYGISDCERAREALSAEGYPTLPMHEVRIHPSPAAIEAAALLAEVSRTGAGATIVLTDQLESRRLNRVYQREGRKHGIRITVVSVANPRFDPAQWWRSREGQKAVVFELCQWVGVP